MPFKSVEALVKQLALYSIDKALKKYIANNAENCFHTDKVLIISLENQCNCTVTEISKRRTILRYLYSPPGQTERSVPLIAIF